MNELLQYKQKIALVLSQCVINTFKSSKLMAFGVNEEGFFCDFDMAETINQDRLKDLNLAVNDEIKKNLQFDTDFLGVLDLNSVPDCKIKSSTFELSSFSGVYENGDKSNKMLQRIYVIAFLSKVDFESHKDRLLDASERDHRTLGTSMKLFSFSNDIGQGLVLWNPKGAMIRYLLEKFSQSAHILNGYEWVYTPHIGKADLWKTSGHLQFYKESMYSPIVIEDEEYYLRPMSCPFHVNIYNNDIHSYKDLPVRYAEYGTVYRYELSGALQGLSRVRGFTQDDAHIICTPDQIEKEVINTLKFSLYILRSFGLNDFKAYVSTKPENKSIGDDQDWLIATESLKKAVQQTGLEYDIDEGGGAFYGPKIDLKLKDALGREWQCSTIQFDFNLPERFHMTYIGNDGKRHTPLMIHRALFGSLERFMALLIEHYKCDFPLWFAPVQFGIVPINKIHNDYCKGLAHQLKMQGYRVKVDYEDTHMREKIKHFELEKIPMLLIVGDKDINANGFSVRSKSRGNIGFMTLDMLNELIKDEINQGNPKYIIEE